MNIPSSFCYFISTARLLEEIQEKLEVAEILCHGCLRVDLIRTNGSESSIPFEKCGPRGSKATRAEAHSQYGAQASRITYPIKLQQTSTKSPYVNDPVATTQSTPVLCSLAELFLPRPFLRASRKPRAEDGAGANDDE